MGERYHRPEVSPARAGDDEAQHGRRIPACVAVRRPSGSPVLRSSFLRRRTSQRGRRGARGRADAVRVPGRLEHRHRRDLVPRLWEWTPQRLSRAHVAGHRVELCRGEPRASSPDVGDAEMSGRGTGPRPDDRPDVTAAAARLSLRCSGDVRGLPLRVGGPAHRGGPCAPGHCDPLDAPGCGPDAHCHGA